MDIHIKNFWETGNGKQLVEWSGAEINLNDVDNMAVLSQEYDVLGDYAVKEIFKERKFSEAYAYITKLAQAKISERDELSPHIKEMFLTMQERPVWLDETLIKAGCDLCLRSGINALISLRDYSLMSGYDYAYLNKALLYTGALKKGPAKRITDTLDFWVHVTRHKALEINAPGYQYIARTRMIHSFSRITIKDEFADWNKGEWGEPINWGDMIATNIAFSLFYLHGLHKFRTPDI